MDYGEDAMTVLARVLFVATDYADVDAYKFCEVRVVGVCRRGMGQGDAGLSQPRPGGTALRDFRRRWLWRTAFAVARAEGSHD